MSISVQERGGRAQLRVKHRLLPRPFFFTFATDTEARAYGEHLHALLDKGVVPQDLLNASTPREAPLVVQVIRAYLAEAPVTTSDAALLGVIMAEVPGLRVDGLTASWVDAWVRQLKVRSGLAPGTIRKRVGSLARVIDWHRRRTGATGENPLRTLPVGYSQFTAGEAAERDGGARVDVQRERRLERGEEFRILAALAGEKRPDRQRALRADPELALFFDLIINTGLRLREAYRLRIDQLDLGRRILLVEGSKGARGALKPRNVPISSALAASLASHVGERRGGLVFSFWTGDAADLKPCTTRLSARFKSTFEYAGCHDLTEHDLRHEATCRWVLMRSAGGGWLFSETEVCKIMGWSDPRMMLRYASLRGEDLSSRLG